MSRALIKFNINKVSESISSGKIISPKFFLQLSTTEAIEIPAEYTILVNPISQSWENGVGRLFDSTGITEFPNEIHDGMTTGASWNYTDVIDGNPWNVSESFEYSSSISSSISASISSSVTQSFTESIFASIGGGAWFDTILKTAYAQPSSSVDITSIMSEDIFELTSPQSDVYTFVFSESIQEIPVGQATNSLEITTLDNFDRVEISASKVCSVTFVNGDGIENCGDEIFVAGGGNSSEATESSIYVGFTSESLQSGTQFVICDGITSHSFIATDNTSIPDNECHNFFLVDGDGSISDVESFATEINSVDPFFITASVLAVSASISGSYLLLESLYLGESGNNAYIWDKSDVSMSSSIDECGMMTQSVIPITQNLSGGSGTGLLENFNILLGALSNISESCGFTFTSSPFTIDFTAIASGSIGNSYSVTSSFVSTSFGGASTDFVSVVIDDDLDTNTYYVDLSETGSLSDNVGLLSNKVNQIVDFVTLTPSSSIIDMMASEASPIYENVCFTSGSTQTCLSGAVSHIPISSSATQEFKFETSDLNVDVTCIVNAWVENQIPNEGFILRHNEEGAPIDFGKLRFYSQDTNTIYIPRLYVSWDDQVYNTGSLSEFDINKNNTLYVNNLKKEYYSSELVRFNVTSRLQYPIKTFSNQLDRFVDSQYLPKDSVYAIQDAESEEYIVKFDEVNKISVDGENGYFDIDMNALPQERYFRFLFKITKNDNTKIFKDRGVFKISR